MLREQIPKLRSCRLGFAQQSLVGAAICSWHKKVTESAGQNVHISIAAAQKLPSCEVQDVKVAHPAVIRWKVQRQQGRRILGFALESLAKGLTRRRQVAQRPDCRKPGEPIPQSLIGCAN